jgi:hypothetical protein
VALALLVPRFSRRVRVPVLPRPLTGRPLPGVLNFLKLFYVRPRQLFRYPGRASRAKRRVRDIGRASHARSPRLVSIFLPGLVASNALKVMVLSLCSATVRLPKPKVVRRNSKGRKCHNLGLVERVRPARRACTPKFIFWSQNTRLRHSPKPIQIRTNGPERAPWLLLRHHLGNAESIDATMEERVLSFGSPAIFNINTIAFDPVGSDGSNRGIYDLLSWFRWL